MLWNVYDAMSPMHRYHVGSLRNNIVLRPIWYETNIATDLVQILSCVWHIPGDVCLS